VTEPDRTRSVTAPEGFRAAGVASGIKASGALDVAVIVNDGPTDVAAGVFTTNQVKAAPVLWTAEALSDYRLRAVVLNSGCANACTGPPGFQDTSATAEHVAEALGRGAADVGVCSTGMIGVRLPMPELHKGIDACVATLGRGEQADLEAATAVLTTDTQAKQGAVQSGDNWSLGGFAKGAGMCAPNLATMLAVITTDAVIEPEDARDALRGVADVTFNTLDIDGGTSTNDTVLLLASGASGARVGYEELGNALHGVCANLVVQLQADAEGVTKEVDVLVDGAASRQDAVAVARTVAEDPLVKTAMFGNDPNWGRIAMAVGRAPAQVDSDRLDITINDLCVCSNGVAVCNRDDVDMSDPHVVIGISLNQGTASWSVLTTDLSHGYVECNSAYST
jgi:glutamate N-acetyltransferase/amino-acid N-acetyltransferase